MRRLADCFEPSVAPAPVCFGCSTALYPSKEPSLLFVARCDVCGLVHHTTLRQTRSQPATKPFATGV